MIEKFRYAAVAGIALVGANACAPNKEITLNAPPMATTEVEKPRVLTDEELNKVRVKSNRDALETLNQQMMRRGNHL